MLDCITLARADRGRRVRARNVADQATCDRDPLAVDDDSRSFVRL